MLFQNRFNEVLKTTSITQRELAEKIGVDASYITQLKKGQKQPNIKLLYRICIVLDVSADYLLGLSNY